MMGVLEKLNKAMSDLEFQLQFAEATRVNNILITKENGYLLLALAQLTAENMGKTKKEQEGE